MADATVKTVQYVDPRIEPQPDPVYDYVIGPTQNQYYKIAASGLSQSSINFNNLTTLGVDRAYLDTFEIELGVTIDFEMENGFSGSVTPSVGGDSHAIDDVFKNEGAAVDLEQYLPRPGDWVMQSFPFNTVCEQARVNINGGAFFSEPMCYLRAKERYMNQRKLAQCYENICPVQKPLLQTESGKDYSRACTPEAAHLLNVPYGTTKYTGRATGWTTNSTAGAYNPETLIASGLAIPTRMGRGIYSYMQSTQGMEGGFNNDIFDAGNLLRTANPSHKYPEYDNYYVENRNGKAHVVVKLKWREPIFVSPFSSRYDATYGRPLYNITSMDLTFNLCDLTNMIRVANFIASDGAYRKQAADSIKADFLPHIQNYTVKLNTAMLCYQVMTIPPTIQKPLTTLVPYRRFVPYITDYNQSMGDSITARNVPITGQEIRITSGVFTLNEIPTAIWIFVAPEKARYQHNTPDTYLDRNSFTDPPRPDSDIVVTKAGNVNAPNNWDSNKLFAGIRTLSISMANTTQILSTAAPEDLYRIAKANGCEDSYASWILRDHLVFPKSEKSTPDIGSYMGPGSVLRLKPGVDIIIPDQQLIPGANANNMVFQCSGTWFVPPHSEAQSRYSLWLLFEYVGVAAISPGQCEISMNPLGSGEIMAVSPVMSATSIDTEGVLEGSGFWDGVKRGTKIASQIANEGILSRILKHIPHAEKAAEWAAAHGFGAPAQKRKRDGGEVSGGAVIGKGLGEWV